MLNASEIKKIISRQTNELFAGSLRVLTDAAIGEPVAMKDDQQVQQYWFTPFIIKNKLVGLCIQNLLGKIILHGLVTPNAAWEDKIDEDFLLAPPSSILNQIKQQYPDFTATAVFFSYDTIPQKWCWQIKIDNAAGKTIALYASHSGWYEKRTTAPGLEG